jgi:hypothetical protein
MRGPNDKHVNGPRPYHDGPAVPAPPCDSALAALAFVVPWVCSWREISG